METSAADSLNRSTLEARVEDFRNRTTGSSAEPLPPDPLPDEPYRIELDGLVSISLAIVGAGSVWIDGFTVDDNGTVTAYDSASAQVDQERGIRLPRATFRIHVRAGEIFLYHVDGDATMTRRNAYFRADR